MMWKAYKYVYYRLYTWFRKMWGDEDAPEFSAVGIMSLDFILIVGSFAIIVDLTSGVQLIPLGLPKMYVVLPLLLVLAGHYFAFMHKGKFRKIEKEFKGENEKKRKWKGFLVFLYAVGSILLFVFFMFFGIQIKS